MSISNQDYFRTLPLYEWTFALLVINFSLQTYRLAARIATVVFSAFSLADGRNLFGSLNDYEIMPYTKYLNANTEILLRLAESFILVLVAFLQAKSLLGFAVVGLLICSCIFTIHVSALILGVIFLVDVERSRHIISTSTALWTATISIEIMSSVMPLILIARF